MRLAIGAENMRVLMRDKRTATWDQLRICQISSGTALCAPFEEFDAIPQSAQFLLLSAFAISSNRTLLYLAEAVQDRADKPKGNTM